MEVAEAMVFGCFNSPLSILLALCCAPHLSLLDSYLGCKTTIRDDSYSGLSPRGKLGSWTIWQVNVVALRRGNTLLRRRTNSPPHHSNLPLSHRSTPSISHLPMAVPFPPGELFAHLGDAVLVEDADEEVSLAAVCSVPSLVPTYS